VSGEKVEEYGYHFELIWNTRFQINSEFIYFLLKLKFNLHSKLKL